MENNKHALVLTGDVLPGFSPATVWPALATYFRMDPERLRNELLTRAPITIKESDDLAKLQNLRAGAEAVGAHMELHALSADGNWFVLVDNTPRGPVPTAFIESRVRSGAWPASVNVAAVGSANWRPYANPAVSTPASDPSATVALGPAEDNAPVYPTEMVGDLRAASPAAVAAPVFTASTPAASGDLLPEGLTVHAGFWRRLAAYTADSFILGVPTMIVLGVLMAAMTASGDPMMAGAGIFIFYVLVFIGAWLYFAKMESGASQATLGKRIMGLKVSNDRGEAISFGRASGRFFGKIVTGLIPFGIGWMLAGWTGRKQALHDMMANTVVVFKDVAPGRPMPTTRPPMPWYGWVLNILPFVISAGSMLVYGWIMATLLGSGNLDALMQNMPQSTGSYEQPVTESYEDSADVAVAQSGLVNVMMVVEQVKGEVDEASAASGECPNEQRDAPQAWIESLELGGVMPECTITARLSSSSDLPFALRIERIQWTRDEDGDWACSSSIDSKFIPWPCD
jgi:uncharacterized RDD family membrane protein YckC